MKKGLFLSLLMFSLRATAQNDTSALQLDKVPDSTAIGSPDGKSASEEIGPEGGRILSDDGRIELIFPPGALTQTQTIHIQPTTNHAPNGTGKAYWFGPSGIKFSIPVQLIFHYTDKEAQQCPPEWMSLASQDRNGKWTFIEYDEWDSTAKTLKGFIHHFSGLSNINDIRLVPLKPGIPVRESVLIDVRDVKRSTPTQNILAVLNENHDLKMYANGVLNGNEVMGTVGAKGLPMPTGKLRVVKYIAPANVPWPNPVIIRAEIVRKTTLKIRGKPKKDTILLKTLTTEVYVYQNFEVIMDKWSKNEGKCNLGEWFDTTSFILTLIGNETFVRENTIKNTFLKITGGEKCECSPVWINSTSTLGTLHIAGVKNIKVVPPNPPSQPFYNVQIFFIPTRGSLPEFRYPCGNRFNMMAPPIMAVPTMIEFLATDREQVLYYDNQRLGKWKLIVRPVTKHD